MYLLWYDDNPKRTTTEKIRAAIAAYVARFQAQPNAVLTNDAECVAVAGVTVRPAPYVRKNNYYVGVEG